MRACSLEDLFALLDALNHLLLYVDEGIESEQLFIQFTFLPGMNAWTAKVPETILKLTSGLGEVGQ